MTVKEIVDLLPNGHPFRIDIDNIWEALIIKCIDVDYTRIMQEYGDYNVIEIEALDGFYAYSTLWLKVERKEQ